VLPDVYLGVRFKVTQYPILERRWALKLPYFTAQGDLDGDTFHKRNTGSMLVATGDGASPAHPFDESKFLPPKYLHELGEAKDDPDAVIADFTTIEPVVKSPKKGYRSPQESEKQENKRDAQELNDALGRAVAIHILRDKTFTVTGAGRFECSWLSGQSGSLAATEKLALILYAYLEATIDGKQGIYEIKDGRVTSNVVSRETYDKLKCLELYMHPVMGCYLVPIIPGVLQVHILLEQDGNAAIKLKEVHCDGDQVFPEP